jgi:hypothetical protein
MRGKPILSLLSLARVFNVEKVRDRFEIVEACDYHFQVVLTPEQLAALGKELIALSEEK